MSPHLQSTYCRHGNLLDSIMGVLACQVFIVAKETHLVLLEGPIAELLVVVISCNKPAISSASSSMLLLSINVENMAILDRL